MEKLHPKNWHQVDDNLPGRPFLKIKLTGAVQMLKFVPTLPPPHFGVGCLEKAMENEGWRLQSQNAKQHKM